MNEHEMELMPELESCKLIAPPKPNVKLTFGADTTTSFQYHADSIPNRFQRWMLLKVFGVKLEKIQ